MIALVRAMDRIVNLVDYLGQIAFSFPAKTLICQRMKTIRFQTSLLF